jgi:hypothetical protein
MKYALVFVLTLMLNVCGLSHIDINDVKRAFEKSKIPITKIEVVNDRADGANSDPGAPSERMIFEDARFPGGECSVITYSDGDVAKRKQEVISSVSKTLGREGHYFLHKNVFLSLTSHLSDEQVAEYKKALESL